MRLYAAGNSLPARLMRNGALRLGNLPPVRQALAARMHNPDKGVIATVAGTVPGAGHRLTGSGKPDLAGGRQSSMAEQSSTRKPFRSRT